MNIKSTILTTLLLTAFTATAQPLAVTHSEGAASSIDIKDAPAFVMLPVEHGGANAQIEILCDGKPTQGRPIDISLARGRIDYYVPIKMKDLGLEGKELSLKFNNIPADALCWSKIEASDTFTPDLDEPYRPVYHHAPPYGWANDPNGMFYLNGTYHFYYQFNPYGAIWGNMHWAHSTSKDMIHWKDEGIVLVPDHLGYIFSGSSVVDKKNVAGFGENAILSFFTSAGGSATQSIAISTDEGYSFTKYDKNPVVTSATDSDFRDPKVIYHEASGKYIMIIAAGLNAAFYSSTNLKDWKPESRFGEGYGAHGAAWECTDLFPLTTPDGKEKWVLLVNLGAYMPVLHCGTQYFIGDFDGSKFTTDQDPKQVRMQDFGMDHYATVTWANAPDDRVIASAWMSNFRYFHDIPTQKFRGMHSIPRDLFLFDEKGELTLGSRPSPEMTAARQPIAAISEACEISFKLQPKGESTSFSLQNSKGECCRFTIDFTKSTLTFDRSQSGITGFSNYFAEPIHMPIMGDGYELRLFIDKSSIECFVNDGKSVMSNLVFPTEPYNELKFENNGTKVLDLNIYKLD